MSFFHCYVHLQKKDKIICVSEERLTKENYQENTKKPTKKNEKFSEKAHKV